MKNGHPLTYPLRTGLYFECALDGDSESVHRLTESSLFNEVVRCNRGCCNDLFDHSLLLRFLTILFDKHYSDLLNLLRNGKTFTRT